MSERSTRIPCPYGTFVLSGRSTRILCPDGTLVLPEKYFGTEEQVLLINVISRTWARKLKKFSWPRLGLSPRPA